MARWPPPSPPASCRPRAERPTALVCAVDLNGRAALVTGGSSGIGAAVVRRLREAGSPVGVLDVRAEESDGDLALTCDVSEEDQVVDAQSLPQIKMPNRDGYVLPEWKHGMPRAFPNKP